MAVEMVQAKGPTVLVSFLLVLASSASLPSTARCSLLRPDETSPAPLAPLHEPLNEQSLGSRVLRPKPTQLRSRLH